MRAGIIGLVIAIIGGVCGWNLRHAIRNQPEVEAGKQVAGKRERIGPDETAETSLVTPSLDEVSTATGAEGTRLLLRYLAEADLASIQALLIALTDSNAWRFQDWCSLLCMRAVDVDAPGFLAWLESADPTEDKHYLFRRLRWLALRTWARVDRKAAIVACASESDEFRKFVLVDLADVEVDTVLVLVREHWKDSSLLKGLEVRRRQVAAKANPELLLAEANANSSGITRKKAVREVIEQWASADAEAAWAWLQEQADVADQARLATVIADSLAKKDAASAIQKLSSLPRNQERLRAEGSIVSQWAKQDLEAAVRWALDEPNANHRASLFADVAEELAKSDPHRLMRTLQEQSMDFERARGYSNSNGLRDAVRSAIKRIAQEDPRQALSYLGLAGITREDYGIPAKWAASEPIVATAWADTLPVGAFRSAMLNPMIELWAASDPVAAAAFVTQGASGNERDYLASKVTEVWVMKEVSTALDWAAGVSENAMQSAVYHAARSDPMKTASFVKSLEIGAARTQAIDNLARTWNYSDPQAAIEWLSLQMAEGEQKLEKSLQYSARSWAGENLTAASEWVGALPEGTTRDHATVGMLETLVNGSEERRDYEAAALWIENIGDEKLRSRWFEKIRDRLAKEANEQGPIR